MVDTRANSKKVEGCDICGTIVSNDLSYSSPPAQDVFKYEGSKGAGGFNVKGAPLRPHRKGASCLDNVMEACC